jgi:hypothetical protein
VAAQEGELGGGVVELLAGPPRLSTLAPRSSQRVPALPQRRQDGHVLAAQIAAGELGPEVLAQNTPLAQERDHRHAGEGEEDRDHDEDVHGEEAEAAADPGRGVPQAVQEHRCEQGDDGDDAARDARAQRREPEADAGDPVKTGWANGDSTPRTKKVAASGMPPSSAVRP